MPLAVSPLGGVPLTLFLVTAVGQFQGSHGQALDPHGPPRVDANPTFLDSFVPAAMQLISHATELMKYEAPPTAAPVTERPPPPPTPPHRPGIFAPPPSSGRALGGTAAAYFGRIHSELYEKVNDVDEDDDGVDDDEERVDNFLRDYDDSQATILRKKKPPPPKAYVTLLSLYDGLNKEAKKLGMNKYAGYSKNVLRALSDFSKGTSAEQMREIFAKIVERKDVKQETVLKSLRSVIRDLEDPKGYMSDALRDIPPLAFDPDF